jgi:methylase of polypeptide subunit release factors
MANARDDRHRYGQHYTPHEVARLLAALAIRAADDLVFDPSCGDGRLLEEALRLKRQLRSQSCPTPDLSDQVFGIERSPDAVQAACRTGARVSVADFFDVEPGASLNFLASNGGEDCSASVLPFEFDAIVGNPPYIRQEVIGSTDKHRIEDRLARDRAASREIFWPTWSRRSDIYVYFFAHSIRFLKRNGRLVFLTASSWMDAGYGRALREFLLENFRVIAVIESAAESFFADASINTCITVLEREVDPRARENQLTRFVLFNRELRQILEECAVPGSAGILPAVWQDDHIERGRQNGCAPRMANAESPSLLADIIERGDASSFPDSFRVRSVSQSELSKTVSDWTTSAAMGQGWGKYLRADDVFFKIIERGGSRLLSLSTIANVRFGVKTGANEFFYLKGGERDSKRNGPGLLPLGDVASVRRGITTGANEFFYLSRDTSNGESAQQGSQPRPSTNRFTVVRDSAGTQREIETELLSPVVFSLKEIGGILIERVDTGRMLFNCPLSPIELEGTRALDYIRSGELAGYHRRPTCSNREPWYSVARTMKPAPLIFPSKVGERWVVALNHACVFEDKKLYGMFPAQDVSTVLLAALLNSTWARYYTEATCRQMTGAQAIADIDVAVAEQIMLPDPRELSQRMKEELETALVELSRRPIYSIFEEIRHDDRRRLDSLTLEAIGFETESERGALLDDLYRAVSELVKARLSKTMRPRASHIQSGDGA